MVLNYLVQSVTTTIRIDVTRQQIKDAKERLKAIPEEMEDLVTAQQRAREASMRELDSLHSQRETLQEELEDFEQKCGAALVKVGSLEVLQVGNIQQTQTQLNVPADLPSVPQGINGSSRPVDIDLEEVMAVKDELLDRFKRQCARLNRERDECTSAIQSQLDNANTCLAAWKREAHEMEEKLPILHRKRRELIGNA